MDDWRLFEVALSCFVDSSFLKIYLPLTDGPWNKGSNGVLGVSTSGVLKFDDFRTRGIVIFELCLFRLFHRRVPFAISHLTITCPLFLPHTSHTGTPTHGSAGSTSCPWRTRCTSLSFVLIRRLAFPFPGSNSPGARS